MADKSLPSIQSRVKIVQIEKRKEEMNMKKFFAILMTLALMLSLAVPAMATDETYTITIDNKMEDYDYEAYQIFDGDLNETTLSNIVWGSGIDKAKEADLMTALKAVSIGNQTPFAECKTAADIAAALANYSVKDNAVAQKFADIVAKYLSGIKATDKYSANNGYTITVTDPGYYLVLNTDVPEVNEEENTAEGAFTRYILEVVHDVTVKHKGEVPKVEKTVNDPDANIGDTVTFTLTATMPSDIVGYETYKVVFRDTLSAGLDFVEGTVKVMIGENDVTSKFTTSENNGTLTISCNDVLAEGVGASASTKIVVTYDAILDDDAAIGTGGNLNDVYLEYSNNPNWDGTGEEPTGDTPKDEEKVYTWEIPVFKYTMNDETKEGLAGAGFTLYKNEGGSQVVDLVATEDTTIYKVCTQSNCTDHTHVTEIVTGETGKFEIEGLEKGTYVLKETTTPAGYNTCADVTVVIGEDGALTQDGTSTTEVGILNQAGSILPETGGMGTTIFYIVGGIMVVAAVVLLVTKKRMSTEG